MTDDCPECGREYIKTDVLEAEHAGDGNRHVTYIHGYDDPDSPMPAVNDSCRVTEDT